MWFLYLILKAFVFGESDVCFRSVIVVTFDGCLVDN